MSFSYFSYQNVKGIINRYKIKRFLNKIKYYDRLVVLTEEDRKIGEERIISWLYRMH